MHHGAKSSEKAHGCGKGLRKLAKKHDLPWSPWHCAIASTVDRSREEFVESFLQRVVERAP